MATLRSVGANIGPTTGALMSRHLDSPLARQDPRLDISDVYLSRGTGGTTFVINVNPLSGAGACHPEGVYEFKVDTEGDAVEDITFRVTFGEHGAPRTVGAWGAGPLKR
ncbi:DUF4331 family protein [Saccharopolyspora shandongensis]|uniref:DUF4331 family protein n=1 Tax=Saccharopolyspora shandongensis TaxID=418495 RepID=UPI003417108D